MSTYATTIKKYKKCLFIGTLLCSMFGCSKKENLYIEDIPGLGGDSTLPNSIDSFINFQFTAPYNIGVKYRWDRGELNQYSHLIPPDENKVLPVLRDIKEIWLDTYLSVAGPTFLRRLAPKQIVLVGSGLYNSNGTVTLGTAEGGLEILLYTINAYKNKAIAGYNPAIDSSNVIRLMHTIHHEFAHILHQTIMYPTSYKLISVGRYTINWNNTSDSTAYAQGFITPYAMSAPDEDFVEMISVMMVNGRDWFNRLVESQQNPAIRNVFRSKEAMVVNYLQQYWNIDFYQLQTKVRAAVKQII